MPRLITLQRYAQRCAERLGITDVVCEEVPMKRVLWLSRHEPTPSQVGALKRLFGMDVLITPDPLPFSSAEEIVNRYRKGGYDDLVVVAPLSVLGRLVDLGVYPLWAEMQALPNKDGAEVGVNGRYYRFLRFRRVKRLVLELEDV